MCYSVCRQHSWNSDLKQILVHIMQNYKMILLYCVALFKVNMLIWLHIRPGKYCFSIKSNRVLKKPMSWINGLIFLRGISLIPDKRWKWIGLAFRRNVMYLLTLKSQRISKSQIFIFFFFTLISIFFNFLLDQPYLSKFVFHPAKKLGKCM